MKHVGWCLENIQVAMSRIPRRIASKEDKERAHAILDEVQEYADTLEDIVTAPSFKKNLHKLEHSSMEEVRLQAHEVEELFKEIEHALYVLDRYLSVLRHAIDHDPEEWTRKADQVVLMIDQKFGGERGELRKEFEAVLHTEEELKEIISSEKHLEQFLK